MRFTSKLAALMYPPSSSCRNKRWLLSTAAMSVPITTRPGVLVGYRPMSALNASQAASIIAICTCARDRAERVWIYPASPTIIPASTTIKRVTTSNSVSVNDRANRRERLTDRLARWFTGSIGCVAILVTACLRVARFGRPSGCSLPRRPWRRAWSFIRRSFSHALPRMPVHRCAEKQHKRAAGPSAFARRLRRDKPRHGDATASSARHSAKLHSSCLAPPREKPATRQRCRVRGCPPLDVIVPAET